MHIEIVRASISIQFDSIQSIVSKFRCIDPTLDLTCTSRNKMKQGKEFTAAIHSNFDIEYIYHKLIAWQSESINAICHSN